MRDTKPLLMPTDFPPLRRDGVQILQVNLGYLCNLSCTHCHVNAGPRRTELMSKANVDEVLNYLQAQKVSVLDLTGGAPEMNPHFRYLVRHARKMGVQVIDRCNLTILQEPGYEDLAPFLATEQVNVVASLPCYLEDNVDAQRGNGVFQSSIAALRRLNALGFGRQDDLRLDLVYNPTGPFLPASQQVLQEAYQQYLHSHYQIDFHQLFTITNMPISRFGSLLVSKGLFDEYMQLLKDNFCQTNLSGVMCRQLLSVDWQGYVYDCDFNQMLSMPFTYHGELVASDKAKWHISELATLEVAGNEIAIADHCYGCTAGQGSSCGGAL